VLLVLYRWRYRVRYLADCWTWCVCSHLSNCYQGEFRLAFVFCACCWFAFLWCGGRFQST